MAVALPLPPPLALVPPPARRVGRRPPPAIPNRPAVCNEGHRGAIRIHGNPDWGSRPFRRPRFMCVPDDPAIKPHTFSEPRRPACGGHPLGVACTTCDVVPGLAQGPLTRVGFDTSANAMGKVLALIGSGDSGRKAAQKVRYDAQRYETDEHGFRYASRAFGLSGRYIDLFGELIHLAGRVKGRERYGAQEGAGAGPGLENSGTCVIASLRTRITMGPDAPSSVNEASAAPLPACTTSTCHGRGTPGETVGWISRSLAGSQVTLTTLVPPTRTSTGGPSMLVTVSENVGAADTPGTGVRDGPVGAWEEDGVADAAGALVAEGTAPLAHATRPTAKAASDARRIEVRRTDSLIVPLRAAPRSS